MCRPTVAQGLMRWIALAALIAAAPSPAYAWGNEGHQIICDIASQRLTAAGKSLVDQVRSPAFVGEIVDPFAQDCGTAECRQKHPSDARSMTFRASCIWPDESRHDTFRATYEYHFIDVPKGQAFDFARDCRALDCVADAVQRYARYLAEPASGSREKERKALSLRLLAHFVADLHQPLYSGNAEDLGGNRIPVKWFGTSSGSMNLHKVWDSEILRKAGITTIADSATLNSEITAAEVVEWSNFDLLGWARESHELAQNFAYRHDDGTEVVAGEDLATTYFDRARPVAIQRLKQAAVRLAHLINAAADGTLPQNLLVP